MLADNNGKGFLSVLIKERVSFGAGLIWSVYFICMFDYPLFEFNVPQSRANNAFNMTMLITLSLLLVATGLYILIAKPKSHPDRMRNRIIIGAVCLGVGIGVGATTSYLPFDRNFLYISGGILSGFGFDILLCAWMGCFCSGTIKSERMHISLSFGFGALVAFITLFLSVWVTIILVLALIVISCCCIRASFRQGYSCEADRETETSDMRGDIAGYGLCAIILSMIYALVGQVALAAPAGYEIIYRLTVFTVFAAGLIASVIELLSKSLFDFRSIYKALFSLIATGLFFLPFLGEQYWIAFNVLVVASFYLFFIRFILLLSTVYNGQVLKGMAFFCISAGLVFGFSLLGVLAGTLLTGADGFNTVKLLSIAFGSLYLLAMGLLPLVKRNKEISRIDIDDSDWDETKEAVTRTIRSLRSSADEAIDKPLWSFSDSELSDLCGRFAVHYRLTAREREVLPDILLGKTSTEISESLVLSQSTVKGHMRTLYRKCDVHSKAELISAVERDRIGW